MHDRDEWLDTFLRDGFPAVACSNDDYLRSQPGTDGDVCIRKSEQGGTRSRGEVMD